MSELTYYMRICDLKKKEVINICDGQRIGCITDIEFDLCSGCITHLIIPGPCKMFNVWQGGRICYSGKRVKQIGSDVILIEADLSKCICKCKWL